MQNAGHTKYIAWSLTFTCSTVSVEELIDQAANMEKELKELLDLINKQRLEFHALNYFTTQQLLQIRRELGNINQDSTREVTPQLHSLLSCFSLDITSDDIKNVVETVCILFNEQEAIYEKQESVNEAFEVQLPLAANTSVATETIVVAEPEQNEHETVIDMHSNEGTSQNDLKLLIENLSQDEEDLFEQLHDAEFSDIVCYYAVKHAFSSNSDNKLNEAMTWCFENFSKFDNDNDDDIAVAVASVSADDHSVNNKNISDNTEELFHKDTQFEMNNTPPKENIDIKHAVVQKLIESNFTPELSIKGARMFNGNFEQAFEWCIKAENKNDEPQQSSFVGFSSIMPGVQVDVAVDPVR